MKYTKEQFTEILDLLVRDLQPSDKFPGRYNIETYKGTGYVTRFTYDQLDRDIIYKYYEVVAHYMPLMEFLRTLLSTHVHENYIDENNKFIGTDSHLLTVYGAYTEITKSEREY